MITNNVVQLGEHLSYTKQSGGPKLQALFLSQYQLFIFVGESPESHLLIRFQNTGIFTKLIPLLPKRETCLPTPQLVQRYTP